MSITDKLITVADNTPAVAESVNAAKATVSGAAIRVDDVLDTEHPLQVQVSSKNLFDISLFRTNNGTYNNGDGTLTVEGYGRATVNSLRSVCPLLKVGDTVTFSFITDGAINGIYLAGYNKAWNNGQSLTITETILDSFLTFYCKRENGVNSTATISNIQVEFGTVATEYMPYSVFLSGVNITRLGKNLFDYTQPRVSGASHIISQTDGVVEVYYKGASKWSSANVLIPNCLDLVGKKITISGKVKTSGDNNATLRLMWLTDVGAGGGSSVIASPYISSAEYVDIMKTGVIPAQPSEEHRNLCLMLYGNTDTTITNGEYYAWYKDIQIEIGEAVTDFVPYKAPQTAAADSSGKVEGLRSVSPTMTVFADNGETVECTYFPQAAADTYAKYQELKQTEIALKELTTNG